MQYCGRGQYDVQHVSMSLIRDEDRCCCIIGILVYLVSFFFTIFYCRCCTSAALLLCAIVLLLNSIVIKKKHSLHAAPLSYQEEKGDPVPPHGDVRSPKANRKIQEREQKQTIKNKSITLGVSIRGKYLQYKEKWSMYKCPIVSMYWKPMSQKGKVRNTMAVQMKSSEDQEQQYCVCDCVSVAFPSPLHARWACALHLFACTC